MTYSDEDIERQLRLGEDSTGNSRRSSLPETTQGVRGAMIGRTRSRHLPMRTVVCCSAVSPTKARCRTCRVNSSSNWILCWSK